MNLVLQELNIYIHTGERWMQKTRMEGVHGAFCLLRHVKHRNKRFKDVYAIKNASTDFKTVFPEKTNIYSG